MAHTVTSQVLVDGSKITIVKINIKGQAATATELVKYAIFDASAYRTGSLENKLYRIQYCLNGFSAELFWNAATDIPLMSIAADHPTNHEFFNGEEGFGGLPNNAASGKTGDILITTNGLASSTKDGFIILYVKEREVPRIR